MVPAKTPVPSTTLKSPIPSKIPFDFLTAHYERFFFSLLIPKTETYTNIMGTMTTEQLQSILDSLYDSCLEAEKLGEIPVAAALVSNNHIVIMHNSVESSNVPFEHAEYNVITEEMKQTNSRYLKDYSIVVSLEPCLFCMAAILKAGISNLYYVTDDTKAGALSYHHVFVDNVMKVHRIDDNRFDKLLSDFFKTMRAEGKK